MKSTLQVLPYIAVQLLKKSSNLRPHPGSPLSCVLHTFTRPYLPALCGHSQAPANSMTALSCGTKFGRTGGAAHLASQLILSGALSAKVATRNRAPAGLTRMKLKQGVQVEAARARTSQRAPGGRHSSPPFRSAQARATRAAPQSSLQPAARPSRRNYGYSRRPTVIAACDRLSRVYPQKYGWMANHIIVICSL